jgi:hypothetical protein
MREKLEHTVATYEEFMARFVRQREFAEQVMSAFDQSQFDVSKIAVEAAKLQEKLVGIAASSYSRTRKNAAAAVHRAAVQKAAAIQQKLRDKAALEAKAHAMQQMRAAAPLPAVEKRESGSRIGMPSTNRPS